jgi:hypothetical protein
VTAVVVKDSRPRPAKNVVTRKGPYVARQLSGFSNRQQ